MKKRTCDAVKISGDYQYKALMEGSPVQRFWHYSKQLTIKEFMPPASSDMILDVGCGSGVITSFLGEYGSEVLGIDGNPDAIKFATKKYYKNNIKFQLGFVDSIRTDKLIDKIYCLELIEHLYINQVKDILKTFNNILKPGGKVFLTTPNYKSMWPIIEWLMDKWKLSPPLSNHQHVTFFNKGSLKKICIQSGFDVEFITTTCLIAPWIATFNWTIAKEINSLESKFPFPLGSILVFIIKKMEHNNA